MNNTILIKINDKSVYKVIKKFYELNINILKIKQVNDDVFVKINYDDLSKIQKNLHTFDITIVDYYGKMKVIDMFKKYYMIITSLVLSLLIITLASNMIVDVVIVHENGELVNTIKNDLYDYGIKKMSFKKTFEELERIKKVIKNNHLDRIEWLEIKKSGMRYIVNLEERIITDTKEKPKYCHVISKKEGIVKIINVYDGEGIININDYVKKGDILISGDVKLNDNIVSHNCASGDIYAEVWYTINIKIPLNYYEKKLTGKKRKNIIINYNDVDYKIFKDRLKDYESSRKKIFDLLGIKIYVVTDREILKVSKKYTDNEAITKGILLAKEKVSLKLKKDEKIIEEKILQNRVIDSTMNIDIFIIAEENIGQIVEAKEDEINDL